MAKNPLTQARVLCDMPHLGLVNGQILAGTAGEIDAMAKAGRVDAHPSAVEYAVSIGAAVVNLVAARAAALAEAKSAVAEAPAAAAADTPNA